MSIDAIPTSKLVLTASKTYFYFFCFPDNYIQRAFITAQAVHFSNAISVQGKKKNKNKGKVLAKTENGFRKWFQNKQKW